ncbi:MAG TPA: DegT/DnrJ/EryC1/StrS family aminotransferase [Terriglobia bacterium]|nr:DegT/DnrJ/EryC1/StrS family aminotransferase [Terriglobia bacterium]
MIVPYADLKAQYAALRQEVLAALDLVGSKAAFILGDEVQEFEREFAAFCGVEHCVAVNSGTSALHLALLGVGVKAGDEVITTANSFFATAAAISYTGAKPVFVDIDPRTANIDPGKIAAAITPRTRAILPVHLYGLPAEMDAILEIADRNGLAVIEDACQAHGARYHGKRAGGIGKVAAFSFYPTKNLGAYGEGGALTTNDAALAAQARVLRSQGESRRYFHDLIGYNYRMEGFQGAILRCKLPRLEQWNARRKELAEVCRRILAGACVDLQDAGADSGRVYHLFVVYVDHRDAVRAQLEERGVQTAIHYPLPIHLQKPYQSLGYQRGDLPQTESACDRVLSMPLYPEMTNEQAAYAAQTLREIVGEK